MKTRKTNYSNRTNKNRKDTQLKFYKAKVSPVLLCGCENFALNRAGKKIIGTAELK
jgi:hypothetical protein